MSKYATRKVSSIWGGIWGDTLLTFISLVLAYFVSSSNLNILEIQFGLNRELSAIFWFVIFMIVLLALIYVFYQFKVFIWGKCVSIELLLSTKPGRKGLGRYLGLYIFNRSIEVLEECKVTLRDVESLDGKWKNPPNTYLSRQEALLWGSRMGNRIYTKTILKDVVHEKDKAIVDIVHTDDKKKKGRIRFTTQDYSETVNAPPGKYRVSLSIEGKHLGVKFSIPLDFDFRFPGGMDLSDIEPVTSDLDSRIKSLELIKDSETYRFAVKSSK